MKIVVWGVGLASLLIMLAMFVNFFIWPDTKICMFENIRVISGIELLVWLVVVILTIKGFKELK